jgi:hypothetical protein
MHRWLGRKPKNSRLVIMHLKELGLSLYHTDGIKIGLVSG